jgi:hypothetical protein
MIMSNFGFNKARASQPSMFAGVSNSMRNTFSKFTENNFDKKSQVGKVTLLENAIKGDQISFLKDVGLTKMKTALDNSNKPMTPIKFATESHVKGSGTAAVLFVLKSSVEEMGEDEKQSFLRDSLFDISTSGKFNKHELNVIFEDLKDSISNDSKHELLDNIINNPGKHNNKSGNIDYKYVENISRCVDILNIDESKNSKIFDNIEKALVKLKHNPSAKLMLINSLSNPKHNLNFFEGTSERPSFVNKHLMDNWTPMDSRMLSTLFKNKPKGQVVKINNESLVKLKDLIAQGSKGMGYKNLNPKEMARYERRVATYDACTSLRDVLKQNDWKPEAAV